MKNPIQFAVVREDPQIEMDIVTNFNLDRATLIGSGGCTAFCLKALKPEIEITLIEPNAAQIELINVKIEALKNLRHLPRRFGIENSCDKSLIECGNFESLFRQFRLFVQEFIVSEAEIEASFETDSPQIWEEVFAHSYWQVAFDLFFSDSILVTMFGDAAIQHGRAFAEGNAESPSEKGTYMIRAPKDSLLDELLKEKSPVSATASILAHRMQPKDWKFILTSDI